MGKDYRSNPEKFKYQIAKKKKSNTSKKHKHQVETYDLGPPDNNNKFDQ